MTVSIRTLVSFLGAIQLSVSVGLTQNADLLIEDFEGEDYGSWSTTGG